MTKTNEDSVTVTLLPCPFCGGAAEWREYDDSKPYEPFGIVVDHQPTCMFHPPYGNEAWIAAWNARSNSTASSVGADESEYDALIHRYIMRRIGQLMHQAEHWAEHRAPLAVHHRITMADAFYQIAVLFDEKRLALGYPTPRKEMERWLDLAEKWEMGAYPPSKEISSYRHPEHVALLAASTTLTSRDGPLCAMCLGCRSIEGRPCPRCEGIGYRASTTPEPSEPVAQAGLFPRVVTHDQAAAAAKNFIDAHFNNEGGKGVLTGVPARQDHDDLVLTDYIKQQRAKDRLASHTGTGGVDVEGLADRIADSVAETIATEFNGFWAKEDLLEEIPDMIRTIARQALAALSTPPTPMDEIQRLGEDMEGTGRG
jgi:hypothetical protein